MTMLVKKQEFQTFIAALVEQADATGSFGRKELSLS